MSTILDALKKIERDRESPHDELSGEIGTAAPPPRRGIPTRVIIACASIGFAAGIGLALWRDTAPLQRTAAPEPVAAPVIDIPPAPAVAKTRPRTQAAADIPLAAVPPAVAPGAGMPAVAPPDATVPGTAAPVEIASAPNPPANLPPAVAKPPPAPDIGAPGSGGAAVPAAAGPAAAPVVKAPPAPPVPARIDSAEHGGSALEPSPFAADRPPPAPAAGGHHRGERTAQFGAARGTTQEPGPQPAPPGAVAAFVPPPPPIAPVLAPPPPAPEPPPAPSEGEPAQSPVVTIDTGRSPPGSPRVSLTFLQWSSDPDRRFAFVSIDGAPAQRVREGDSPSGMTVAEITPTGVQFKREGQLFMIRPRH